jgi:hypothetical protein
MSVKPVSTDLITGEIPDSIDFVIDLFQRQKPQLFVVNKGSSQFQISVQFGRLIGAVREGTCNQSSTKHASTVSVLDTRQSSVIQPVDSKLTKMD